MLKQILKVVAPLALTVLVTAPLAAQIPLPPLPGLEIRVGHTAPPPLRVEVRPSRPSRDHVWAPGSWDWQGNDWAWAPGRWDRPERHGSRWIKARYVREGRGWRYEPGHWSYQRVVEGDDYRRWRSEQHGDRDRRDHDRDRDHDRPN
jgi:WXXGXW repeat (2 copies)